MPPLFHIILFLIYAAFAAITSAFSPDWVNGVDQNLGMALGGIVFLVGALFHQTFVHFEVVRRLNKEIVYLKKTESGLMNEMASARRRDPPLLKAGAEIKDQEARALGKLADTLYANPDLGVTQAKEAGSGLVPGERSPTSAQQGEKTAPLKKRGKTAPPGKKPAIPDDAGILEIARGALSGGRVDLIIQPIVTLPQRKLAFFECFAQLRGDGDIVLDREQYLDIATRAGLIGAIDNMLLIRCVQLVRSSRRKNTNLAFFCNISIKSLTDKNFFSEFISFMAENAHLASSMIFEFAQHDLAALDDVGLELLGHLSGLGFRFSINKVDRLDMNLDVLAKRRVKFIKAPVDLLLREAKNVGDLKDLKNSLDLHAMDMIVEGIDDEKILLEVLEHPVDFGQGEILGEPRMSRESA